MVGTNDDAVPDGIGRGFGANAGRITKGGKAVAFFQSVLVIEKGADLEIIEVLADRIAFAAMVGDLAGQMAREFVDDRHDFTIVEFEARAQTAQWNSQRA